MDTWQNQRANDRNQHIRHLLDTIDALESGSKLMALNMAVKTAQAHIAGHDITIALERITHQ